MDWEIDEDRQFPIGYVLAPKERSFILEGDAGNYSKNEREKLPDRIEQSAKSLPSRFQDLIDDLTLFYMYGVLDIFEWGDPHISDLAPIYATKSRVSDIKGLSGPMMPQSDPAPALFGFELGCAIRLLFEENNEIGDFQHFLWGMLLSEITNKHDNTQEQEQYLEDLFTNFRQNFKERITALDEEHALIREYIQSGEKAREIARRELLNIGMEPTNEKVEALIGSINLPKSADGITPSYIDNIRSQIKKNQITLGIVNHLKSDLQTDTKLVLDRNLSGVSPEKLLKLLLDAHHNLLEREPLEIGTLNEEIEQGQRTISRALGRLKRKYPGFSWPQYDVVEGSMDSGKWKLTGYGKLLAIHLFKTERETQWMYEAVFDNTTIHSKRHRKRKALKEALHEVVADINDEFAKEILARSLITI